MGTGESSRNLQGVGGGKISITGRFMVQKPVLSACRGGRHCSAPLPPPSRKGSDVNLVYISPICRLHVQYNQSSRRCFHTYVRAV